MEAPSLPDGFEEKLRGVREGLHLRWNPKAKVRKAGAFDVYGNVAVEPEYDGRWELWDNTIEGKEYMVMTIREPGGGYKHPGDWLITLLNKINPANYGGSVGKMVEALVDDKNRTALEVGDKDFEDLIEQATKWVLHKGVPKTRVLIDL